MSVNQDLKYTLSLKDLFSKKMNGAIGATGKLDSKMGALKSKLGSISTGIAAAFSVGAIVSFGKSVVDSLKNYEYFSASLRVLLHGDRDAATLLGNQLTELAKVTPFSLVDVQDSAKKLLAYGFAANDVIKQMTMLGDISAATGNQIGDVAYLYGTLRTQGKAMTKDLYQFTNRGINVIPLLAKQFGILESQVYKFAEQGKIGFKDIERAFITMTEKGGDFHGMMNEQSKTVGGKISNMGDAWEQLKITIGKSQTGILNSTISWVTQMINALNQNWVNEDKVAASFNKFGAEGFSKMAQYNKFANPAGEVGVNTIFQDKINKAYVDPSTKGLSEAVKSQLSLTKMITALYQNKDARKDMTTFNRTVAILKGSLAEVQTNIGVFKNQSDKGIKGSPIQGEDEATGSLSGLSSSKSTSTGGTEISGTKPQSLVINIGKLVESQNIYTTTMKESASKVKEMISQVLLETVNDVNLVTR